LAKNIPILNTPDQPYIIRSLGGIFEKVIPAKIKIKPETLNLTSRGILTAFLQIEPGFGVSVSDINPAAIKLSGAQLVKTFIETEEVINLPEIGKADKRENGDRKHENNDNDKNNNDGDDNDKVPTLIAKFRISDLINVTTGKKVPLLLTAQLFDGTKVEGSDTVRVIRNTKQDE